MKYAGKITLGPCLVTATSGLTACSKVVNNSKETTVNQSTISQSTISQSIGNQVSYSINKEVMGISDDSVFSSVKKVRRYGSDHNKIKYQRYRNVISLYMSTQLFYLKAYHKD